MNWHAEDVFSDTPDTCTGNYEMSQPVLISQLETETQSWSTELNMHCPPDPALRSDEPCPRYGPVESPSMWSNQSSRSYYEPPTSSECVEFKWPNNCDIDPMDGLLCEDGLSPDNLDFLIDEPALRSGAKVRERKRMLSINSAFEMLRTCLPTFPYERRISKIDTLRLAIAYLALLRDMLHSLDEIPTSQQASITGTRVIRFMFERLQAPDRHSFLWYTSDATHTCWSAGAR
ncbi:unnamed protein product [Echinostoma caproni]|uniref:BHLH domain-containing protein n=1 Tax=Echinostoma caproni TaxID=27848 RepID=A0A183AH53_9TREM|nr:unnamed protein product [Echinostoma caproni]